MDKDEISIIRHIADDDISISNHFINTTLYQKGDACIGIDVLVCGTLIAYTLSQNGSESIVFEFGSGSVIGANLLFGNINTYPMNIYCKTDCEVIHISKNIVEKYLHNYDFVMDFVKSISQNSQDMNKKIAMYSQKSLRENILDYLSVLSVEQKTKTVTLPITKKQLADYFGVQRPSLFRELKNMKEEGIIELDNKNITVI